jgi:anaerobic ribonucleoside-triphosphate reductase activating protein
MKIGGEVFPAFNPYDKPTYEIHISGCTRGCKGCHNKILQDFNYGDTLEFRLYLRKLKKRSNFYDAISIIGGDLLCQDLKEAEEFSLLLRISFPEKELWLFTGENNLQKIPKWAKEIFDYIKIGCYQEELKQEGFPSSKNQKLLKKGINY